MQEIDFDTAQYILSFYGEMKNETEKKMLSELSAVESYLHLLSLSQISQLPPDKEPQIMKSYGVNEKMIETYKSIDRNELMMKIGNAIYERNKDQIEFNLCPICGTLARTPLGRQARCGHRW